MRKKGELMNHKILFADLDLVHEGHVYLFYHSHEL